MRNVKGEGLLVVGFGLVDLWRVDIRPCALSCIKARPEVQAKIDRLLKRVAMVGQ